MKKQTWIYIALILACIVAFNVYLKADSIFADRKAPEILFSQELPELSVADGDEALLQGVTATDDRDGDVTASIVVEKVRLDDTDGTITVTYAAFDKAGHVTKAQRQARYTDYESPRFSLSKSPIFIQNTGMDIFDVVTAVDLVEGDISHRIRVTSLDDSSLGAVGSHQVELSVSNSLGETVKLAIPLEVNAAGSYSANVTLKEYLVYLSVGDEFNPKDYLQEYIRSGLALSLTDKKLPKGYELKLDSNVDMENPGVYWVDYRVSETVSESGAVFTGMTRLIVVVEG